MIYIQVTAMHPQSSIVLWALPTLLILLVFNNMFNTQWKCGKVLTLIDYFVAVVQRAKRLLCTMKCWKRHIPLSVFTPTFRNMIDRNNIRYELPTPCWSTFTSILFGLKNHISIFPSAFLSFHNPVFKYGSAIFKDCNPNMIWPANRTCNYILSV